MTVQATDVVALRRWVRRTQSAHRERGATAGNLYFAMLFVLIVGGMLHRQLGVVFWPGHPNASELAGAALVGSGVGGLYLTMRRLGPLGLSRPATSWLLTAPVSRRRLLGPSLWLAAVVAALAGALFGIAIAGHVAARPMPGTVAILFPVIGALAGMVMLLVAFAAQAEQGWAAWADQFAGLLLAAGLAGFVVDSATAAPRASTTWPAGPVAAAAGALAVTVAGLTVLAVARLAATPNDRILEASKTAGTLLDSVFGVEPSFVADMVERRYWARRRLRSVRWWPRLPPLIVQDLLMAARRPRRLLWLAGATTLPALLAHGPHWLMGVAVLFGGMIAAGTTTATVRTDAGNPVMLRLLGLDSRRALYQRVCVPSVLAATWYAVSLTLLRALGDLPAGPWWALGLALGPIGAVAAVRRARVGLVRNELLPLDTPMGTISPGPLLSSVIGPDALLLGTVVLVQIGGGHALSWTTALIQASVSALCLQAYVSATTSHDRVELS